MNSETLYAVADGVATLTLNRPEKRNAWTLTMAHEATHWMRQAEADADVRVVLLTGAGGGFCAGADMSLLSSVIDRGLSDDIVGRRAPLPEISKPVIAAVDGAAVGLGLALAVHADLRIASEAARFGTAFAQRGLIAEFGLAWMLPRIVGLGHAKDLLLTARLIDAAEAHRIGLVSHVMPSSEFHQFAAQLASSVSPRSTRIIKAQLAEAGSETLIEAFETSEREMLASLTCDDFKEGVAHFMEKRAPRFTGR